MILFAEQASAGIDKLFDTQESDNGAQLIVVCQKYRSSPTAAMSDQLRKIDEQHRSTNKPKAEITVAVDLAISLEAKYTKHGKTEWAEMIPEMIVILRAISDPSDAQVKALAALEGPGAAEWLRSNVKSRKNRKI